MRVYDWASDVKDAWFIDDGIHFTSPGYAARAELIAQALAHAFPAKGETERRRGLPGQLSDVFASSAPGSQFASPIGRTKNHG